MRRAADAVGGQAAMAELLGYRDRRNVWPWINADDRPVPAEHCPTIERASGVPVDELRRDLNWLRVPDASWPHPEGRPVLDFVGAVARVDAPRAPEAARAA